MFQAFRASLLVVAILAGAIAPDAIAATKSNLTVTINGLRNQRGRVCLSLFASAQGFPASGDRALKAQCVKVGSTPPKIVFSNLNAGTYAVTVIHDANSDGTLNRNALGIPLEGFGFSRNPVIRTGPPTFQESAVAVSSSSTSIQIQLKYFLGG